MPKHKAQSIDIKRSERSKDSRKVVCIYCNGEQTERLYFKALIAELRLHAKVELIPKGDNRLSLVECVKKALSKETYKVGSELEVWLVFDADACFKGDNNPKTLKRQANDAVAQCTKFKYKAIVSNDSFELWFYLHYKKDFAHRHRDDLSKRLNELIFDPTLNNKIDSKEQNNNAKYEKNTKMYDRLRDKQDLAIKHAKELCASYYKGQAISKCQPYTNVHELVEAMQQLAKTVHSA